MQEVESGGNAQFLKVIFRAGDWDWHFEWEGESLRIHIVLIEQTAYTDREIMCDRRTVGQKGSSRLKLNRAVSLFFHANL